MNHILKSFCSAKFNFTNVNALMNFRLFQEGFHLISLTVYFGNIVPLIPLFVLNSINFYKKRTAHIPAKLISLTQDILFHLRFSLTELKSSNLCTILTQMVDARDASSAHGTEITFYLVWLARLDTPLYDPRIYRGNFVVFRKKISKGCTSSMNKLHSSSLIANRGQMKYMLNNREHGSNFQTERAWGALVSERMATANILGDISISDLHRYCLRLEFPLDNGLHQKL